MAMDSLGGESLARSLGCGEVGPVELPEQVIRARPRKLPGGKWAALGAFAILGTTAILVASGPTSAASAVGKVWQEEKREDGPAVPADADEIYALKIEGLPNVGRSDARVTMVVIADYACSVCADRRQTIESLKSAYGNDLRIVYKPHAKTDAGIPSLAGACAAALQGEFEAYDKRRVAIGDRPVDGDEVFRIARVLALDTTRFTSAIRRCEALVRTSTGELDSYGFSAETYFVNGKLVDPWGYGSLSTFENTIDAELVKAKQRIASGATTAEHYYQDFVLAVGKTTR